MNIGKKIQDERDKLDMTQRELADKIKISYSVMNRIESGERPVRDEEIKKIAEVLGITTDYLLGLTENPNQEKNSHNQQDLTESDEEIELIQRAHNKMDPKQRKKMMKLLKLSFEDLFKDEEDD